MELKTAAEAGQYAFFLDIDGTLYNHGIICRKNRTAIREARQAGHLVFINTARSYGIIPEKVKKLKTDGVISSIGCSIIVHGERQICAAFEEGPLWQTLSALQQAGYPVVLECEEGALYSPLYEKEAALTVGSPGDLHRHMERTNIAKAYIPGTVDEKTAGWLTERYMFFQHGNYAEFAVLGHTKATGIAAVLKMFDIPPARSVAMGDSMNDADMLRACGISVAMGDGHPQIKAMSTVVTGPAALGGVAEGIYRVLAK